MKVYLFVFYKAYKLQLIIFNFFFNFLSLNLNSIHFIHLLYPLFPFILISPSSFSFTQFSFYISIFHYYQSPPFFLKPTQFLSQRLYTTLSYQELMHEPSHKFQGSPQKFRKAAFCDLIYTQSKLYDHVLYKDLLYFKELSNFKSQTLALTALNELLQDKNVNILEQKNTIIQTQQKEINFLRENNRLLSNKNIERTHKIIKDHENHVQELLMEKEKQILFVQGQKEILEGKISLLESELSKYITIVSNWEKEMEECQKKQKQFKTLSSNFQAKINNLEKIIQQLERDHKIQIKKLNDEKLDMELHFKRLMVERSQDFKIEFEELERFYTKKFQLCEQQKLNASLAAKESLNRTMKNYQSQLEQVKQKASEMEQMIQKVSNELNLEKMKSSALSNDLKKQDEILDKYEVYLKQSDDKIISLKEVLLECQEQLEKAKISLEKNRIERDSFENRIKICEEEAKMWRESYYLTKSRACNDN